jgi:hypothetical protein
MSEIFISYRRIDSQNITERIHDRLKATFGDDNVFKDVGDIPPGKDYRGVLHEKTSSCDVMLVIIGKQWLTVQDLQGKRRLDDPNDWVRFEVEAGLQRGIPIIPVLVDNADMPGADDLPIDLRELAFRQAVKVRYDPDFDRDMEALITILEAHSQNPSTNQPPSVQVPPPEKPGCLQMLLSKEAIVIALITVICGGVFSVLTATFPSLIQYIFSTPVTTPTQSPTATDTTMPTETATPSSTPTPTETASPTATPLFVTPIARPNIGIRVGLLSYQQDAVCGGMTPVGLATGLGLSLPEALLPTNILQGDDMAAQRQTVRHYAQEQGYGLLILWGDCNNGQLTLFLELIEPSDVQEIVQPEMLLSIQAELHNVTDLVALTSAIKDYLSGNDYSDFMGVAQVLYRSAQFTQDALEKQKLELLRANSLLFAGCYADAIQAYANIPSTSLSEGMQAALYNNQGYAFLNRGIQLLRRLQEFSCLGLTNPTDPPTSVVARDTALARFDSAGQTASVPQDVGIAYANKGTTYATLAYLPDGNVFQSAMESCNRILEVADGYSRLLGTGYLCQAINTLGHIQNQTTTCMADFEIDQARDYLDKPEIDATGLNATLFWRGYAATAKMEIAESTCSPTDAVKNILAADARKNLCAFLDAVDKQRIHFASDEMLTTFASDILRVNLGAECVP